MQLPGANQNNQQGTAVNSSLAQPHYQQGANFSAQDKSSNLTSSVKGLFPSKLATFVIILLQVAILGVLIVVADPQAQYENFQKNRVISAVEDKVDVNSNEDPTIAIISNIEDLRDANEIQQEVYKDAANEDYILAYSDKIVIYRPGSGSVIYEGLAPADILAQNQQEIVGAVVTAAVEEGVVTNDQSANPEFLLVQEPEELRRQNPEFYALAQEQDVISYFPSAEMVVLYRPSEQKILNSGNYRTVIE